MIGRAVRLAWTNWLIRFERDQELLHMRLWCRGDIIVDVGAPPGDVNDWGTKFVRKVIGHERTPITCGWICGVSHTVRCAELIVSEVDLATELRVDHRLL